VTLLARLREPASGRITVDGTDLRDLDARGWQRQVAVVNQDFGRYPLSARENVAFRDLTADGLSADFDEAALEQAAAQADALEFVRALPHGWDTICAPGYHGGTDLSGGQWQRLALARALYAAAKGARVLVLDEPTAQLDIRAEAAFYNRFLELTSGLTTMVISHRFATVRRAERIAVLEGGGSPSSAVTPTWSRPAAATPRCSRCRPPASPQAAGAWGLWESAHGSGLAGPMAEARLHGARRLLPLRRLDILFGTAWRAAPLLATECVLAALGSSLLMLAYPLGFRAIVDGALAHHPGRIVTGLIIVAIAFPGGWVLQLIGGALNAKMTDLANLRLGLRIGGLTCDAPFLEHFERPDYLAEIDGLRERRRTLAGAPAQTLGMIRSGIQFVGAAVLLALVWPPLVVVPLLAIAPAVADRKAAKVEKRSDDDLADRRRLLGDLFSLASTAAPARELRTFGVRTGCSPGTSGSVMRSTRRRCARLTSPRSPKPRGGSCTPPDSASRSSPSCCEPRTATPPRAPWSRSSACCAAPSAR
jgi:ABC-type dipeptide/oligopeptide/nickel transport system ATPase subunit